MISPAQNRAALRRLRWKPSGYPVRTSPPLPPPQPKTAPQNTAIKPKPNRPIADTWESLIPSVLETLRLSRDDITGRLLQTDASGKKRFLLFLASPHGKGTGEGRISRLQSPHSAGNTRPITPEFPPGGTGHTGNLVHRGPPIATDGEPNPQRGAHGATGACIPTSSLPPQALKRDDRYDDLVTTAGGSPP